MPYIIGGILVFYIGFVVYKKVKDIKNGKFCSCGSSDCTSSCKKRSSK